MRTHPSSYSSFRPRTPVPAATADRPFTRQLIISDLKLCDYYYGYYLEGIWLYIHPTPTARSAALTLSDAIIFHRFAFPSRGPRVVINAQFGESWNIRRSEECEVGAIHLFNDLAGTTVEQVDGILYRYWRIPHDRVYL